MQSICNGTYRAMPQHKGTGSLSRLCLVSIAKNMESLWCADYIKNFFHKGKYIYVIAAFEYLSKPLKFNFKVVSSFSFFIKSNPLTAEG